MKKMFVLLFILRFAAFIYAKPLDLEVNAENAILINAKNNKTLFAKKENIQTYPASVTKMVTVWYVIEKYSNNLNQLLTASENALKVIDPDVKSSSKYRLAPYLLESDGTNFDIQVNEKLTLKDLLHGMVIKSGNDASNVVAENLGKTIENFMKDMNDFLKEKGFSNTNFCNPHGLYMPDHITTVYDIAHIMKLALNNPKFLEIFSCKYYIRPKTNKQQKKEIVTNNKLIKPGKNYYKYAICSKTGYHTRAKYNLVSVAEKDNRTLIAVVFGCPTNDGRYEDTIKLFETAFSEKKVTKKVIDKGKLFLAKIVGGSKTLKAALADDLYIEFYPSEERECKAQLIWDDLVAPVKKGQKVGTIQLVDIENEILKKQNIYAISDVKRTFLFAIKKFFVKK